MRYWESFLIHGKKQGAILRLNEGYCVIGYGSLTQSEVPSTTNPSFWAPDFFLRDRFPWWHFEHTAIVPIEILQRFLESKVHWTRPDFSTYQAMFHEAKAIKHLLKTVPYSFVESNLPINPIATLSHVLNTPYHLYGCWNERNGMLGATPEILIEGTNNHYATMALAGTATTKEDLMTPSIQIEHEFVVQDLMKKLPHAIKSPQQVISFGSLFHLLTPLDFIDQENPIEITKKLHPTAALGTFPHNETLLHRWNQISPRERFGAPFAFYDPASSFFKCVVAIRNVQWNEQGARIFAGGGITQHSELEKEWNEINLKISAIQKLLSLSQVTA